MLGATNIKDVKFRISELVKLMRKRDGLTQQQLAEKLAVSRITIQNLESGKNATTDTLLKVLQYFGLMENLYEHLGIEIDNNSQASLY